MAAHVISRRVVEGLPQISRAAILDQRLVEVSSNVDSSRVSRGYEGTRDLSVLVHRSSLVVGRSSERAAYKETVVKETVANETVVKETVANETVANETAVKETAVNVRADSVMQANVTQHHRAILVSVQLVSCVLLRVRSSFHKRKRVDS